jgi:23S rRNA (adenine2503-C2)-methyltransferase
VSNTEVTRSRSRARVRLPLVASHSRTSLERLLVERGGTTTQAKSAAARVFRHVHREHARTAVPWDRQALLGLGIGAWAEAPLLELDPSIALEVDTIVPAADGTIRLALRARDGALVETVIIPGPSRTTVCISSQVGCARACSFCETGALGLTRQLDSGEIVDQVRLARAVWGERSPAIQNVVFMGMGEPFDNLGEVARATQTLTDQLGFALAPSRITVSTVGVADKLPTFFETCRAELAVSLNAPDDQRRSAIMPINDRFNMNFLKSAIVGALPRGRKVLFEYVLIEDFNDAPDDADLLATYVRDVPSRVNVIPVNPGPNATQRAPRHEVLTAFVERLASRGVTALVRRARGQDVGGACGQLAGERRSLPIKPASNLG